MAVIIGTSGNDKLKGTGGQDTLVANGGSDLLLGKGGADTYQLLFNRTASAVPPNYVINETNGGDASVDRITGVGALVQNNPGGILDYAAFRRTGPDGQHLVIETASKVNHWSVPGIESGTIKIINQHNSAVPGAQIEIFSAGGVDYNLLSSNTGTASADIMTGWKLADTMNAGAGNDFVSGGGGRDTIHGDDGNDIIFGDGGGDHIYGDQGSDTIFGGAGNDKLSGGLGNDQLNGGDGKDVLRGQDGNDVLNGGANVDRLIGGHGNDTLNGGAGDDILIGNKGADTYVVSALGSGNDTIIENGKAPPANYIPYYHPQDTIRFDGYSSMDTARHNITITVDGNDLVFTYTDENDSSIVSQLTVQDQFLSGRFAIEHIHLGHAFYQSDGLYHIAYLSGDNHTYSVHDGSDAGGEDIVLGSTGDDEIYGGLGHDILVGAGGADQFMFHDEGPGGSGSDIIQDFDLSNDILDFTEIDGISFADMTITDNEYGNAVIDHGMGTIELWGISAADIDESIFNFL